MRKTETAGGDRRGERQGGTGEAGPLEAGAADMALRLAKAMGYLGLAQRALLVGQDPADPDLATMLDAALHYIGADGAAAAGRAGA